MQCWVTVIQYERFAPSLPRHSSARQVVIFFIPTKEEKMSVARVTEIISSSKKSFEDAIEKGIDRAAKTLKNVEGAWVKEQKVIVKNGKISEYRVDLNVTFILVD
jgi:flavin-binding protein dodecin